MALSSGQRDEISDLLMHKILGKLESYSPETTHMPFHIRLLGKDRMALFSFVHSINTMLGISIFEQVAAAIARPHFRTVGHQHKGLGDSISSDAQSVIQRTMDDLRATRVEPDKPAETARILAVAQGEKMVTVKRPTVDLFLEDDYSTEYYFDLKTAKPNIDGFVRYKRVLLEWIALRGAEEPTASVRTLLAIPYNPYEPKPYERWTLKGLFDIPNEIMVAAEFWDFLGGEDTYSELLDIFQSVGLKLRPEIDQRFSEF
ncbi:TdeIII family type II restriction endonuclease [Candidatus Eisenbacteria bacterium]|uniref:type II site-specific deoxyribonuclease n=1 Tax=Eiseniibacteriota bacterium TaxID=2212470 RepID=A0ABV6YML1_UNCEI